LERGEERGKAIFGMEEEVPHLASLSAYGLLGPSNAGVREREGGWDHMMSLIICAK